MKFTPTCPHVDRYVINLKFETQSHSLFYLSATESPVIFGLMERVFIQPEGALQRQQLKLCDPSRLEREKTVNWKENLFTFLQKPPSIHSCRGPLGRFHGDERAQPISSAREAFG